MTYLIGTWSCERTLSSIGGIGRRSTSVYSMALNGQWLLETSAHTTGAKLPVIERVYYGYDARVKKWIRVSVDSDGGYDLATSDGMIGTTMNFVESAATAAGQPIWRFTTAKLDATHFTETFVGPTDATGTINAIRSSCTKM